MIEILEFIRSSFWHVAPILAAGIFAGAIIVERTRALFKTYPIENAKAFFERVNSMILNGRISEAVALCDTQSGKPQADVVKQALLRAHQPEELIENGISIAVSEVAQKVYKRTSFLSTVANVATLLGLFGTIAGLIHSFQAVGNADAQQKSTLLAAGISQAMNATMFGLAVAIPCMVAFSLLMSRTNCLMAEIDEAALRTLDMLKQRYYGSELEIVSAKAAE